MASSGTYNYAPPFTDLLLYVYGRLQIRPPAILAHHMNDALVAAQLLLGEWSVKKSINLWEIELNSISLVGGQSAYPIPANVVGIYDYYLRTTSSSQYQDRVLTPISRTEYAAYPNKLQQGTPTTVWWNRSPAAGTSTLNVWEVPPVNTPGITYELFYYAMTQVQDVVVPGGVGLDIPWRFLAAFADGLSARLGISYPPPQTSGITVDVLDKIAERSWDWATGQDTENVPMYIIPGLGNYFRN